MKSYKRLSILMLITLSLAVTYFIESSKTEVPLGVRNKVETAIANDTRFPVRPVWWDKGHVLAVGLLANTPELKVAALDLCQILIEHKIMPAEVQIFDVLKIQNEDDWQQISGAVCKP